MEGLGARYRPVAGDLMSVTIDIVDQDVFTALRALLIGILPTNTPVVQGQVNLVAMPTTGFVVMTSLSQDRLSTNTHTYDKTLQTKTVNVPTKYEIQLDFYGATSQAWSAEVQALFRDSYAIENMPSNIVPLYADDPMQLPLINGEEQFEQRWKIAAALQYNPIITVSQQSALTVNIALKEVDTTFTP